MYLMSVSLKSKIVIVSLQRQIYISMYKKRNKYKATVSFFLKKLLASWGTVSSEIIVMRDKK